MATTTTTTRPARTGMEAKIRLPNWSAPMPLSINEGLLNRGLSMSVKFNHKLWRGEGKRGREGEKFTQFHMAPGTQEGPKPPVIA